MFRHYLFMLLFLFTGNAQAQQLGLLNYTPEARLGLDSECLEKLTNWENSSATEAIYFVEVLDATTTEQDGELIFSLPDVLGTKTAEVRSQDQDSNSDYTWYGTVEDGMGEVMLISNSGNVFGYITYAGHSYDLRTLCNGHTVMIKSSTEGDSCNEICTDHDSNLPPPPPPPPPGDCCHSTVLFVYTNQATIDGNPSQVASIAFQNLQQALVNSEICHTVELAGIKEVGFIETEEIFDDRDRLKDDLEIKEFRDVYGADIVILIAGDVYDEFGIAFLGKVGNEEFGYGIAEVNSPAGRHTIVHEWAHDFGATHQQGMSFGDNYYTIETPMPLEYSRILHFTNPDVSFMGHPTGVEMTDDNASIIELNGCIVADYRIEGEPCDTYFQAINVDIVLINSQPHYRFCAANTYCPIGIGWKPKLNWSISADGVTWINKGTEDCFTIPYGFTPSDIIVKLDYDCGACGGSILLNISIERGDVRNSEDLIENVVRLYPNPAQNYLDVEIGTKLVQDISYEILDMEGKLISQGQIAKSKIRNNIATISVAELQSGMYSLLLFHPHNTVSKKFIIQK